MAMARKTTTSAPAFVNVRYDLFDLPTAQHKAGLAGLLLQVESMKARGFPPESTPQIQLSGPTTVEATFTETSLRGLLDDLYDANFVEVRSSQKWQKKEPKRVGTHDIVESTMELVDEIQAADDGNNQTATSPEGKKRKTKKWFVYDVTQPRGHFLRQFTDDGKDIWHKLWREMLWAVPRGKPTTRRPFDNRAAGKSSGEGEVVWKDLLAMEKAKRKNGVRTCEVAGAILLGAQATSAEAVPFRDRVDNALLLHFWQLTTRVFVPEHIVIGENDQFKSEFVGYVLAVPEVADLGRFTLRYTRALHSLTPTAIRYRPANAVISLPEQGALEFMDSLARLAGEATSSDRSDVTRTLAGVEFFHFIDRDKKGKKLRDTKVALRGRVAATPALLAEYEAVRDSCRNPMFRAARLLAMLRREPWYKEFEAMMAERPWPLFVQSEGTPRNLPSLAWDATQKFRSSMRSEQTRKVHAMSTGTQRPPAALETLVYRLVRTYVRAKTEQKSGITYSSFKDKKVRDAKGQERVDYPRAYTEAQEKVCSDLFLGLRSRRDNDFVSYFTGTVGSVAQGPNLSDEADFRVIAKALLDEDERRDVQTLAMLAVAAASYASTRGDDEEDATATEERAHEPVRHGPDLRRPVSQLSGRERVEQDCHPEGD